MKPPPRPKITNDIDVVIGVTRAPSPAALVRWTRALLVEALGAARGKRAALSLLLCGDGRMRTLNRSWRRRDRPTDVLSFPAGDGDFLGDVVIDVPYAGRQARGRGHDLRREVQILLTHGLLHLLGYDHEVDDGQMFRLQARLVTQVFGRGPDGVPGGAER